MASIIRKKLPENLKLELEKFKYTYYNKDPLSVKLLREFINYQIQTYKRALDVVELTSPKSSQVNSLTRSTESNWRGPNNFRGKFSSPTYSNFKHIKTSPNLSSPRPTEQTSTMLTTNDSTKPATTQNYKKCLFCGNESHRTLNCTEFSDIFSRRLEIQNQNRCTYCLSKEHNTKKCDRIGSCYFCKERHNSSLCPNTYPIFPEDKKLTTKSTEPTLETTAITLPNENQDVDIETFQTVESDMGENVTEEELDIHEHSLPDDQFTLLTETLASTNVKYSTTVMQTARCQAFNCANKDINHAVRIILDSASGRTYITNNMAQKLNLPKEGLTSLP